LQVALHPTPCSSASPMETLATLARRRVQKPLRKLLQIYLVVAGIHSLQKLLSSWLRAWRWRRTLKAVPKARGAEHPVMGHILSLIGNRKRVHDWRNENTVGLPISKELAPIWSDMGNILIIRDPVAIRHFLKDSYGKYTKSLPQEDVYFHYLRKFLGHGIFTALHGDAAPDGGHLWMQQRKIATQIFSRSNFNRNMREVFVAKAHHCSAQLVAGEVVDMQLLFFNFTMDSIMRIFFGCESDLLGGASNDYAQAYDVAHRIFFEYAVTSLPRHQVLRFLPWPFGGFGLAAELCQLCSPLYWRFRKALRTLDVESRKLVAKCRKDPALADRNDLLALFVQAEGKQHFSTAWLRDMVLNFVIAGRDTTACSLSWMFYIFATHPELQARAAEEVARTHPTGTDPTLQSVAADRMPVLHGLLYETLRLYPPVPFDVKQCFFEDVLPDGTPVPRNTILAFVPYSMGRDPAVYPDPEVVRPERWIPFTAPPPHEFPVFQAGPRICLGMEMAIFEAKVVAVVLLRDWSFTLKAGEAEKIHYSAMLTMSICNSKEQDSHSLLLVPQRRDPLEK